MKWQPVERHDGSRAWVEVETGEMVTSLSELFLGLTPAQVEVLRQPWERQAPAVDKGARVVRVSEHDHVGSMKYGDGWCECAGCGQRWVLTESTRGLHFRAESYSGFWSSRSVRVS